MFRNLFDTLAKIADVYDSATHVTVGADPLTWRAYESFCDGLRQQYARILASGIIVRQSQRDSGADSRGLFDAIGAGSLTVYNGADLPEYHALAADSGLLIVGDSGAPELATLNTIFRVCHDFFGHYADGARNTFGARGETAAFLCHAAMFPTVALPALACETICQVAYFYAGAHVRRSATAADFWSGASLRGTVPAPSDSDFIPLSDRPFAPQKNSITAGAFAVDTLLNRRPFGATIRELASDQKPNSQASAISV